MSHLCVKSKYNGKEVVNSSLTEYGLVFWVLESSILTSVSRNNEKLKQKFMYSDRDFDSETQKFNCGLHALSFHLVFMRK